MLFSATLSVAFLAALSSALPIALDRRALSLIAYNDMSISAGVGGNAQAEALAVWTAGVDLTNLAGVSAADLAVLNVERENAEDAETEVFNQAISAASGATAAALQVGKIKNKVLKLTGELQVNNIKLAQAKAAGKSTTSIQTQITATQKKLTNNIKIDISNKGKASTAVKFVGQTSV